MHGRSDSSFPRGQPESNRNADSLVGKSWFGPKAKGEDSLLTARGPWKSRVRRSRRRGCSSSCQMTNRAAVQFVGGHDLAQPYSRGRRDAAAGWRAAEAGEKEATSGRGRAGIVALDRPFTSCNSARDTCRDAGGGKAEFDAAASLSSSR